MQKQSSRDGFCIRIAKLQIPKHIYKSILKNRLDTAINTLFDSESN